MSCASSSFCHHSFHIFLLTHYCKEELSFLVGWILQTQFCICVSAFNLLDRPLAYFLLCSPPSVHFGWTSGEIIVVPEIGKKLGSSSKHRLTCLWCDWLGEGLNACCVGWSVFPQAWGWGWEPHLVGALSQPGLKRGSDGQRKELWVPFPWEAVADPWSRLNLLELLILFPCKHTHIHTSWFWHIVMDTWLAFFFLLSKKQRFWCHFGHCELKTFVCVPSWCLASGKFHQCKTQKGSEP